MAAEVSCREAVRLLSAAIDRSLSGAETTALERHLAECLDCRNYGIQVKFLRKAAGRFQS